MNRKIRYSHRKIGMCANNYEEFKSNLMYLVDNQAVREEMGLSAEKYAREVHGISNLHRLIEIISDE